jgi:serine/threonine protein kinase
MDQTKTSESGFSQDPLLGTLVLNRYKLTKLLGYGNWGSVYKAEDQNINRVVAVKILHAHLSLDSAQTERFQREVETASKIGHPGIAIVYDYGTFNQKQPCLIMEYLEGTTLEALLARERRMPVKWCLSVFAQACNALSAAHAKGIVHRDIKPANLMIMPNDRLKIMDFGLAKLNSEVDDRLSSAGDVCGTLAYLSPEQWKGENVDARTDIYALGCTMYEALSGRKVCNATAIYGAMIEHTQEDPPSFAEACKEIFIPPSVEDIVRKAIAKAPQQRFQTASDFESALSYALLHPVSASGKPSSANLSGKPSSANLSGEPSSAKPSNKQLLIMCGIALTVFVLSAVYGLQRNIGALTDPSLAERMITSTNIANKAASSVQAPAEKKTPADNKSKIAVANPEHSKTATSALPIIVPIEKSKSSQKSNKLYEEPKEKRSTEPHKLVHEAQLAASLPKVEVKSNANQDEAKINGNGSSGSEEQNIESDTSTSTGPEKPFNPSNDKPAGSEDELIARLQSLAPDSLKILNLTGCSVGDKTIDFLSTRAGPVRMLFLDRCVLTEKQIESLTGIRHLRVLSLVGCSGITPSALERLASSRTITKLAIGGSQIDDNCISKLSKSNLEMIALVKVANLSSAGFQALSEMKRLSDLRFVGCSITAENINDLKSSSTLEHLWFVQTPLSSTAIESIANLPGITSLVLHDRSIHDDNVAALSKLTHLQTLDLRGAAVNRRILPTLLKMPELKSVAIHNLSSEDLTALANAHIESTIMYKSMLDKRLRNPRNFYSNFN